ncbi:MAG: hypothetical protein H6707_11770 [Deltaproteobacteria bacterium]|nr:hypothetical protein [Deltaproteobacteria bacterium]
MTSVTHELRVRPDKIASVCTPFKLGPYLAVAPTPVAERGVAVVGRVLTVSAQYGHIELRSGRPAVLVPGDIIVGVLGARAALRGFCGDVPDAVERGDILWLLNKGGVIGKSAGATVGLGEPIQLEVIGTPVRDGKPLRLSDYAIKPAPLPDPLPPVLVVGATCMHAGKTTAAGVITHHLTRRGIKVHAGKATGVAALADLMSFSDNGAVTTLSFVDAGLPSTCNYEDVPTTTRTLLAHLAQDNPDVIVLELGDGLLGAYGVDDIIADSGLTRTFRAAIVAANDIIGGLAASERLRAAGINVAAITGPATDNEAGRRKLAQLGFAAANTFHQPGELCTLVCNALGIS